MGLRQGVIELLHALAGRVGKGEKLLCDGIAEDLELEKYTVEQCYDGAKAYDLLLNEAFDLLILDLNLPGMDGLDLLRVARAEWPQLRVLILSARAGLSDRITGLDLGADDYLTKPFALGELEARVRSLLRREFVSRDTALTTAGLTLDTRSRSISAGGEPLEHVLESNANPFSNVVRMHISSLRKKLREALSGDPIQTKVGQGYRLMEDSEP